MQEVETIKVIYKKIQNQLFYMIPEKWDKIYLYASIAQSLGNFKTGEMFFYYFPKGILKKKPINSYEIPSRFNLDENQYIKSAIKLYDLIKELKEEFNKLRRKSWTNITIKIEGVKFTVEFNYDEVPILKEQVEKKHILWAYNNLKIPVETLSKEQRNLLITELEKNIVPNKSIYSDTIYYNPIKYMVKYQKEQPKPIEDMQNCEVKTQILSLGV